jgi:GMP synthase-like glutamine amidotransferase
MIEGIENNAGQRDDHGAAQESGIARAVRELQESQARIPDRNAYAHAIDAAFDIGYIVMGGALVMIAIASVREKIRASN